MDGELVILDDEGREDFDTSRPVCTRPSRG